MLSDTGNLSRRQLQALPQLPECFHRIWRVQAIAAFMVVSGDSICSAVPASGCFRAPSSPLFLREAVFSAHRHFPAFYCYVVVLFAVILSDSPGLCGRKFAALHVVSSAKWRRNTFSHTWSLAIEEQFYLGCGPRDG